MSVLDHYDREIALLGWDAPDGDEMQKQIVADIRQLLVVFSSQGHSGMSAPYAVAMFERAALFQPLSPLTGEDSEWVEVSDGMWQNKRCSSIFKDADGKAYRIDGKVFREPDGATYTSGDSRVPIQFPWEYVPPTIVEVTDE